MINALLAMGLSGSAVTALWLLLYPAAGDRFTPRWHDRMLKLALALFLLPVGPLLRNLAALAGRLAPPPLTGTAPSVIPAAGTPDAAGAAVSALPLPNLTAPALAAAPEAAVTLTQEGLRLLAVLWAAGALGMLVYKAAVYFRFRRRVLSACVRDLTPATAALAEECARAVGFRGRVTVKVNPLVGSPFAMGLLRPAIVLPAGRLDRAELRCVFLHELAHIRRGDLWVRALSLAALVLHWYNPFVYLLSRRLKDAGEQVCDDLVTGGMSRRERYGYGRLLLKSAAADALGDWAAPMSAKGSLKRRLTRIFYGNQMTGRQRAAAALAAALLLTCGAATALTACSGLVAQKDTPAAEGPQTDAPGDLPEDSPAPSQAPDSSPAGSAPPILSYRSDVEDTPGTLPAQPDVTVPESGPSPLDTPEALPQLPDVTAAEPSAQPEPSIQQEPAPSAPAGGQDPAQRSRDEIEAAQREYEAAQAEVDAMDLPGQIAAAGLTYPYPTLDELLAIPAVASLHAGQTPSAGYSYAADGDFPVNANGETYGAYKGGFYAVPDLILAEGTQGEEGYFRQSDMLSSVANSQVDRIICQTLMEYLPNGYLIPLYDCEGAAIGWFHCEGGRSVS